jgi:hypothetical protein
MEDLPVQKNREFCFRPFGLLFCALIAVINASAAEIQLDRPIVHLRLHPGGELYDLCEAAQIPCGIEEDAADGINTKNASLLISSTTIRIALKTVVTRYGHYKWSVHDNVVNVEPMRRSADDQLSQKLDRVSIHDLSSLSAAMSVVRQSNINCLFLSSSSPFYGRVNIDLKDVTIRDALNEVARQDGQFIWSFRPSSDPSQAGGFSFTSWRKDGMSIRDIGRIEHN